MAPHIDILASTRGDNFFYMIHDGTEAALIDPIDADLGIAAIRDAGLTLTAVLNTHWHPDHDGGNAAVLDAFEEAILIGPAAEADQIAEHGSVPLERGVAAGDAVTIGDLSLEVFETPGHTGGHISYMIEHHLFSGDVIFGAGAGNCRFGGDPGVLYETFAGFLGDLDEDVVFYPGHDYAVRNLEFGLSIQPEHDALAAQLKEARKVKERALLLTTIGQERAFNPFLRTDEAALQQTLQTEREQIWTEQRALASDDREATFRTLRALRDAW